MAKTTKNSQITFTEKEQKVLKQALEILRDVVEKMESQHIYDEYELTIARDILTDIDYENYILKTNNESDED